MPAFNVRATLMLRSKGDVTPKSHTWFMANDIDGFGVDAAKALFIQANPRATDVEVFPVDKPWKPEEFPPLTPAAT